MLPENPLRLAAYCARRVLGTAAPWCEQHAEDMRQAVLLRWHQCRPEERSGIPTRYWVISGICAARRELSRLVKQAKVPDDYRHTKKPRPEYTPLELREIREDALTFLARRNDDPVQGALDSMVLSLWLDGHDCAGISARCGWLTSRETAEAALYRIITALREHFGADVSLPIRIRGDTGRVFASEPITRRRTRSMSEYNRAYYQAHRAERIRAAAENRRARKARQKEQS